MGVSIDAWAGSERVAGVAVLAEDVEHVNTSLLLTVLTGLWGVNRGCVNCPLGCGRANLGAGAR